MGNVFLTGFMGTGKTAVGRTLARRLARRFVDLDQEIERSCDLAVAEIFARFGERDFRARERRALERCASLDGAVVATGGGTVVDAENRATMHACGAIVCLTAEVQAILSRVGDARNRPLLATAQDPARRVRDLLEERAEAYADADFTIDTSGHSVEQVVDAIAGWLRDRVDASARASSEPRR